MNGIDNLPNQMPSNDIEKQPERWYKFLNVVYLLLLIAVAGLQLWQNSKIEKLIISDEIGLYDALQRPLEGKWHYELDWKIFHGDTANKYMSYGDAFFIWDSKNFEYEILIGYRIKKLDNEQNEPVVLAYMIGKLKSTQKGVPIGNIHQLQYLGRMSTKFPAASTVANNEFVEMINLKYEEDVNNKNRINKISGECDLVNTKGIITFAR